MITVVCKANFCRSPVAERILKFEREDLVVQSKGIINFDMVSMDRRSAKFLESRKISSERHMPKLILREDIKNSDLIIVFDLEIFNFFRQKYSNSLSKIKLFNYYDQSIKIIDPINLDTDEEYFQEMEKIETLCNIWAQKIKNN